jgi:DNA-directed RNA polymerase delta subunit
MQGVQPVDLLDMTDQIVKLLGSNTQAIGHRIVQVFDDFRKDFVWKSIEL